jgi:hypothetical protein
MAVLVGIVVHTLPDLVSVVLGPLLGALTYGAFLRVGRIVDAQDLERLGNAGHVLPRFLRNPFRRMLGLLAPT